jgi:hypothetical protein
VTKDTDAYEISNRHNQERISKLPPGWTEGDVERLVVRVSEQVMNNFYEEVGRSLVKRMLQSMGWLAVAGLTWLAAVKARQWVP